MNILDKIFNRDILTDIKKDIICYQRELSKEADKEIKDYEFDYWIKNTKWLDASFELRLEFNNLYFNYKFNFYIK